MTPRTHTKTPRDRASLRPVPPPVDSEHCWRKVMNLAYGCGEDALFAWLRDVRAEVCGKEKPRRGAA